MSYTFYDCIVTNIIDETHCVKRYVIQYPEIALFHFKAGQFVMLDLPIIAKHTTRSYSIASAPGREGKIELCIVLKPDGPGTTYLFNKIKTGDILKSSMALGKFILPETIDREICFICTGTGIAPFRSMVFDIFNRGLPHKDISLIFGNRFEKDILYRKEFENLAAAEPSFNFIPVLSRETPDNWKGAHGYVHAQYQALFQNKKDTLFYICGWPAMLKETRQALSSMGFPTKQIRFESFD